MSPGPGSVDLELGRVLHVKRVGAFKLHVGNIPLGKRADGRMRTEVREPHFKPLVGDASKDGVGRGNRGKVVRGTLEGLRLLVDADESQPILVGKLGLYLGEVALLVERFHGVLLLPGVVGHGPSGQADAQEQSSNEIHLRPPCPASQSRILPDSSCQGAH
ncbi:hypothetical protein [Tetrasphaera phage TJE1]|uniref:Uncharacterized protein n=1 Tax=Tetrasphaera phage TJE1 TaxID=981335 RepID=G4W981_9CAUD|nr:hypothetical protein G185_gp49 [Tetrasphaera phage TJE1]ADX42569.1 hypothetical protein [Tetrasphaera phage TJE1]